MNFITLIVFGLVIGMLAKVLIKDRNPAKYLYTLAAGIAGSLIGGAMANMHMLRGAAETARRGSAGRPGGWRRRAARCRP